MWGRTGRRVLPFNAPCIPSGSCTVRFVLCPPPHTSVYSYATASTKGAENSAEFWRNVENQKSFFDAVAADMKFKKWTDWYSISRKELEKRGAKGVLRWYLSLPDALKALYPEHPWEEDKFSLRKRWTDPAFRRNFLDQLGKKLGVKEWTDWYKVPRSALLEAGAARLLGMYSSWKEVLKAHYPEHPWDLSKFVGKAGSGYWQDNKNVADALDRAEKKLGITKPEDWYTVTLADLKALGVSLQIKRLKLVEILREKYPGHDWTKVYLLRGRYGQQKRLENAVTTLFPNVEMKVNVRKEAGLLNPQNNEYLELDIFLPSLNLALEFQERHHYTTSDYTFKPVDTVQATDKMKQTLTAAKGITLITVPCWWDCRPESLFATIVKARPDLQGTADVNPKAAIPDQPPPHYFTKLTPNIAGIGEPTQACFLTAVSSDPTNWWLFEKYDGVRGFWNPEEKAFYSRLGNKFTFPKEVLDSMPTDIFLDGELWFGEERFQDAIKLAYRGAALKAIDWNNFKYMVFDIPTEKGTYQERYDKMVAHLGKKDWKHVHIAPKEVCAGMTHLESFFQDVVDKGGEGIILRDPTAPFQAGRCPGYLKHKKFRDAEAKIVQRVGSHVWECELPNGVTFTAPAGTMEFARRWDPQPGDIVSFKHHGYLMASKKPKLPTLYRLRKDLQWDDVINGWKEQAPLKPARRFPPQKTNRPKGYWEDIENRRKYFLDLAESLGFDPLEAKNWSNITSTQVASLKGGGLLTSYGGSLRKTLKATFPELKFSFEEKLRKHYWRDINKCRTFFDDFAKEKGFDPLDSTNWQSFNIHTELSSIKGGSSLAAQYGGFKRAIQRAYPELSFPLWQRAAPLLDL